MAPAPYRIAPVASPADLSAAKALFAAYATALDTDLAFQGFASEMAGLPGHYAPPAGALLLARTCDNTPIGCVALRPIPPDGTCEMKRLYVAPQARGLGLGRALINAILGEAARIGYRDIRLDTLPAMAKAIALYTNAGFTPIEPYYLTPLVDTMFLGRSLAA